MNIFSTALGKSICRQSSSTAEIAYMIFSGEKTVRKKKYVCNLEIETIAYLLKTDLNTAERLAKKAALELMPIKIGDFKLFCDWFQSNAHITIMLNGKLEPYFEEIKNYIHKYLAEEDSNV